MMSAFSKGFEWLLDLARKAEESENNTYIKMMRMEIKDRVVGEYSIKVKAGLNRPPLLNNEENKLLS